MSTENKQDHEREEFNNSLLGVTMGIRTPQNQIAQQDTIDVNLRRYMISNNRMLLSYLYVELGLVQTLIDQPIDDAYSALPSVSSKELTLDDIKKLQDFMMAGWFDVFKQSLKWGRLFGGSALFINVANQKASKPLDIRKLRPGDKVEIYAVDRWEMQLIPSSNLMFPYQITSTTIPTDEYVYLYDKEVHQSRIKIFKGKMAPSILRPQLLGWGMSEIERLLRSMNCFLKNQDVIFELLDEAKVDVYKIQGFNAALGNDETQRRIENHIRISNSLKNYLNAVVMDKDDDYVQKTMHLSGLADMGAQNQQNVASDLKMPLTKLFGMSSAGFNSGEDDIENYNAMLESEVRAKSAHSLYDLYHMACMLLFGFIPSDLSFELPPLRTLTAEQVENVKNSKFNRLIQSFQVGALTPEQFLRACDKDNLLGVEFAEELANTPAPVEEQQEQNIMEGFKNSISSLTAGFSRRLKGRFGKKGGSQSLEPNIESQTPELSQKEKIRRMSKPEMSEIGEQTVVDGQYGIGRVKSKRKNPYHRLIDNYFRQKMDIKKSNLRERIMRRVFTKTQGEAVKDLQKVKNAPTKKKVQAR